MTGADKTTAESKSVDNKAALESAQAKKFFQRNYFKDAEEDATGQKGFSSQPDFSKMTQQEKLQWNLERIRRSM